MQPIYLDNNATTPLLPEVAEAMRVCDAAGYANPASQHAAGRRARAVLEEAREGIGRLLGANQSSFQSDQVIFTSGGTEANNLALLGMAGASAGRVAVSPLEHPSIATAADQLAGRGWAVDRLPVDAQGVVELAWFAEQHTPPPTVVSVMLGSNETGVVQPIAQLAARCRAAGSRFHTDAVQAVGKIPVDFTALGVDTLACAAHKFHGPRGIGALVVRHDVELNPILFGGFQQAGIRPGTESVTLAVGMHRALRIWHEQRVRRQADLAALRNRFEARLRAGWPELVVHAAESERLPHTSAVAFPPLDRQALVMALDLAGVACSTGSACASGSSEPSPALLAMGCPSDVIESSLRFSFGALNRASEVDAAAERILGVCHELRHGKSRGKMPPPPPASRAKRV